MFVEERPKKVSETIFRICWIAEGKVNSISAKWESFVNLEKNKSVCSAKHLKLEKITRIVGRRRNAERNSETVIYFWIKASCKESTCNDDILKVYFSVVSYLKYFTYKSNAKFINDYHVWSTTEYSPIFNMFFKWANA